MNIKYFISTRFTEPGNANALGNSLSIIKTIVEKINLAEQELCGMLVEVSALQVGKNQYSTWTSCVGAFMAKMGARKFFAVLPLRLVDFDFFSLTYAQDSRSWMLPLIEHNLKIDANLDFFVEYFMPMVLQLDKLRELEQKAKGSEIKVKKYETLLVQIWQLLPQFCSSNSPHMSDCFAEVLKYLEPILNKNLFGLRNMALKTFSRLIEHCRNTKQVDEEIKKTRKGLSNIAMDYITGLVQLYTNLN